MLPDDDGLAVSVVLCTWNRAALLDGALAALTAQHDAPPFEILVVDNASTDRTRDVVTRHAAVCDRVRYLHEPRQGLSFARNTGIAAARGEIVAFTDDDVRVGPEWVRAVVATLDSHPDAACAGGPVMPAFPGPVPSWLTPRHWAPLGIQDYGDERFRVDRSRAVCLIGANLAVRRAAFARVGGFAPAVQRVGDGFGSTEDHEWQLRLWASGGYGIYEPLLRVQAPVAPERVTKPHHRAWHFGHGRHVARMRMPDMEQTRMRLFGLPVHLLRQALRDAAAWLLHALRRDPVAAFQREVRLWFTAGFLRERWG